jgi:uncharacterized protein YjcR
MSKLDIVGMTEIAEMLNISVETIKTWNRRGQLPTPDAVVSAGPFWRRSTIERWAKGAGRERVTLLQKLGAAA